ncbi:helix-turn-helix domain-containing protein [Corynebacterium callunae]|uniref:XRE family transcriptional regulator n=1 Tax=Corynebacterium callunae DSM 20147 TaxID=1121353 RepID=M1UJX4_9CORY|nr:helix-turn-helix domain-containing protein [Corynebacterium callunae]AGG66174.1 XRE family transcriptional regulator [Corynebacterium callunae DSM 20147]
MTSGIRANKPIRHKRTPDECVGIVVNQLLFTTKTTKRELGAVLGISGATAGRKVRGEISWSLDDLYATADFFGVNITDLLPRRSPLETPESPSTEVERDSWNLVAGAGFEPTTSGL